MHVVVNAAVSADGKLALRGGKPLRLSGPEDLARVHRLRAASDGILVGVGTVLADDPSLLVKAEHVGRSPVKHPVRVVLDSSGRTPQSARVLDGRAKTLVVTGHAGRREFRNAENVVAGDDRVDLRRALLELEARGIRSLMVEGGATIVGAFLGARLVDEMFLYHAPVVVGGGAPSLVEGPGAAEEEHVLSLDLVEVRRLGEGVLTHWRPKSSLGA